MLLNKTSVKTITTMITVNNRPRVRDCGHTQLKNTNQKWRLVTSIWSTYKENDNDPEKKLSLR